MKNKRVSIFSLLLMFQTVCAKDYAYSDVMISDIFGNLCSVTLPNSRLQSARDNGLYFDGSSIAGYTSIAESDIWVMPDFTAAYVLPWNLEEMQTQIVFGDVYTAGGALHESSPRSILKRAVAHAQEQGFQPYMGIEVEFYLLRRTQLGEWVPCDNYGYCETIPNSQMKMFQIAILEALQRCGIEVEKIHHEVAPGQYEVVIKYTDPVRAADSLLLTRYIIQAAAQGVAMKAVFMPKPFAHHNGSGMHVHVSLFDALVGTNAFYDPAALDNLSAVAKHFIAGNLRRLKELELLYNSSVNSFKRLVPGYEAPVYVCWGKKNRSAALRIPDVSQDALVETNGAPLRVEFRIIDGSCNPYLAFAALIEAGLAGIHHKEQAPESVEENLYHISAAALQERGIETIAPSLGQALEAFKASDFGYEVIGLPLWAKYVEYKSNEWSSYTQSEEDTVNIITEWEKCYFGISAQN